MNSLKVSFHKKGTVINSNNSFFFTIYAAIILMFLLCIPWVVSSKWIGTKDFHAIIEIIGCFVALLGSIACIIFYLGLNNRYFLIVGIGFFIAGSEDLVNGVLSFDFFNANKFPRFSNFMSFTDLLSRVILMGFIILAVKFERIIKEDKNAKKRAFLYSALALIIGTAVTFDILFIPVPEIVYPNFIIPGPFDLLSIFLYVFALYVTLKRYFALNDIFSGMLAASILLGLGGEVYASFSRHIYDIYFSFAHYANIFSYIMPVLGISLQVLEEMKRTNEELLRRKAIEKALRESEERYKTIFTMSPDYIYLLDLDSEHILDVNPSFLNILGIMKNEVKKVNLLDFYAGDNTKELDRDYALLRKGQEIKGRHIRIKTSFGKILELEVNSTPVIQDDKLAYILNIARDITEKKRMEELEKRNEENKKLLNEAVEYDKLKTEFFANISHELRTPLNIILGVVQLLELYVKDGDSVNKNKYKIKKYMGNMRQNSYRLLRLVNNLIDITKIDSGFFELNLKNHDIINIIEDTTLSIAEYIENNSLTLEFDTEVEERVIACDEDKIERIMLNLLSNAIKFTEPGGSIKVNIFDKKDMLQVSVKDSGIGIPEDKLHIIFDRFRQVDKSLTRNHEGSGIGLSIVKSLVELHGGRIYAKSEYSIGSEFIFELPAMALPESDNKLPEEKSQSDYKEKVNIEFSDIYSQ